MKKNKSQDRSVIKSGKNAGFINRLVRKAALFGLVGSFVFVLINLSMVSSSMQGGNVLAQKEPAVLTDEKEIGPEAVKQIAALQLEKELRTPAQRKIDSNLLYKMKMDRGESIAPEIPAMETGLLTDENGLISVDIRANVTESLMKKLQDMNAIITASFPQYRTVAAEVPLNQIESLAEMREVIFIMPQGEGRTWQKQKVVLPSADVAVVHGGGGDYSSALFNIDQDNSFGARAKRVRDYLATKLDLAPEVGSQNSQGDTTHKASNFRSTFGGNGAGVRIGVLSNGVTSLAASQGLGDLGPVTILPGQAGTGDEGTAMLEIVHDLAPGAELYYATALPNVTTFAQNIRDLRAAGCDIIIDDVFYTQETPFQDGQAPSVISTSNGGIVTQAVNEVTAAGAMFFSSAGNQGNQDDGTSSCYQGDFAGLAPAAPIPLTGTVHNFGGGVTNDLIQTGSPGSPTPPPIDLYWADPLGGAANDYDLYVLDNSLTTVLASSTNIQSGTQDPFEETATGNATGNRIVVYKKPGAADRFFHITINANGVGKLGTSTEGTTKGHSMSALAYSTGATPALSPGPFPSPHSSANVSETFSSDGPRRIFFQPNGAAYTPGVFSSAGGTVRQKPDITAADRVSVTGVGGFGSPFSGTSAAAPHAGAIAGLLLSQFPNLTPAQIRTLLTNSAIDIEGPGTDRDTGVGIIMPFEAGLLNGAVASANFEKNTVTATELGGDGDTFIEPNETGSLNVNLINTGVVNATAVSAVLSTTTPNVTILSGNSAYPNLTSPSGTGSNVTPFTFKIGATAPCDLLVNFTLTVSYSTGNSPKAMKFSVQTGRPPASSTTTMDASPPPVSVDYTAVTGNQTNRVTRNGLASTCNLPKAACPGVTAATSPRYDAYTFRTCPSGGTRCVTATLTTACPTVSGGTQLFATAYLGSFVPTAVCTNYLADAGSSPAANGTTKFTFNVPAGQSFVLTVADVPGATTVDCPYTMTVSGLCNAGTCATAASVNVRGRVTTAAGKVVAKARVYMSSPSGVTLTAITNAYGFYNFDDLEVGNYVFNVFAKGYTFESRLVVVNEEINDLDFVASR